MEFRLPDIGEGLTEAEVVRWLVPVGGFVEIDAPLVEVETDKAVVEIPSPFAGVVQEHGAEEGDTIKVGAVLVVIGETAPSGSGTHHRPARSEVTSSSPAAQPTGTATRPVPAKGERPAKAKALPVIRKLARDLGVDLAEVTPTGPDGTITREDVERAASGTPSTAGNADERVPMTRLRRTIAAHMERSWREIPHVTTFDLIDGSSLLDAKATLERLHDRPFPIETLVIKAVVPILVRFPSFNATLEGDGLILHRRYDIGVAVDTQEGLIVPVIKAADTLDLTSLAEEITRLSAAAKQRSVVPDEIAGATFTISNIGAVGGGFGTPIIPYGTTAILSVGRATDAPVVRDGELAIAPMVPLSLSYDHRVVDGREGRAFMTALIESLENPEALLA